MSVTVEKLISDFNLEVLVEGEKDVKISVNDINRPGLQLACFYNYFAPERIQVIGKAEWSFLDDMGIELMRKRINKYFSFNSKCVIMTRGLEPHSEFLKAAKKTKTWLLRTNVVTTKFISKLTMYLAGKLAPETRLGKSETALELIKRGHRLVSDDAVDIKEIDGSLIGTSPKITIGMLEVRGIGIIDISSLYGLSSILPSKDINLLMHFEHWKDDGDYDRLGIDKETQDILGVKVRRLRVPVRPGRNIAVIIEAAAGNYRHSLMSDVTPVDIIEQRMCEINDEE